MKKLITFLIIGAVFCGSVFAQAQSNDAYPTGWLSRSIRGGGSSGSGDLKADGTVPLTADWNVGAFNLTAKNYTASESLGAELITNVAGFTPDVGGDWSYAAGAWTHIGAGYNTINSNVTTTAGHWYKVQYQASDTSGLTAFQMGGNTYHYLASSAVQTYYVYALSTGTQLWAVYTGFTGNISGFSIKELTNGEITAHNLSLTGRILLEAGTAAAPSLAFKDAPNTGLFNYSDTYLEFVSQGVNFATGSAAGLILNTLPLFIGGASDLKLTRGAAATLQLGVDGGTPIAQTFQAQDSVGTNITGSNLTLRPGNSTGSGAGGTFTIQTTPAGASGSTERTPVDRFTIDSTGLTTLVGSTGSALKIGTNSAYGYLKSNQSQGFTLSCTHTGEATSAGLVIGIGGTWPISNVNYTLGDPSLRFSKLYTALITDTGTTIATTGSGLTQTMINNTDSDTDEVDSVTWAGGSGMLIATCTTDASATAVWRLEGTTLVALSVNALFTVTKDAAATYNVYFEGGAIKLQNKVGDNKVVKLGFFGI